MLETVEMVRVQIRVKLQKIQCKEEKDKDLLSQRPGWSKRLSGKDKSQPCMHLLHEIQGHFPSVSWQIEQICFEFLLIILEAADQTAP